MHSSHIVPELALARVVTAGGPYRAGNDISLAFTTPSVARLVAHDAASREARVPPGGAIVPEIISVVVIHSAAPYVAGDLLTLCFVDPGVARVQQSAERSGSASDAPLAIEPTQVAERRPESSVTAKAPALESTVAECFEAATPIDISYLANKALTGSARIREGEAMTLRADAILRPELPETQARASASTERDRRAATGVSLRLEWSGERIRRFVQVVDKLFTIDRLGWYRHSLAMRLLIPDEIGCGDALANVEAMRHLQALRAAAVEALGKPLLAACMPGFSISSDWLETLESPREARAIAGLRDALLPYASDEEPSLNRAFDGTSTTGSISRRRLLPENATSVEAFLPLLIATQSHDPALCERLTEYRRLLVELFAQTARAGEPVRLHQMAQPNHSLDDRLWQVVGAAGEAFGGFARA